MKWAFAIALLASACGPPDGSQTCFQDSECSGDKVCANTEECYEPSNLRTVSVHWTVNGATPDATRCAPAPTLTIMVVDRNDSDPDFGTYMAWGPVACTEGAYYFTRLPTKYNDVELMGTMGGGGGEGALAADGTVTIDMQYATP